MCSFAPSMPESCRATLSRRDGWEGKGLFGPVCPEKPSALGCVWHEQRVALGVAAMADFSWACCAWLGLCSAESSLPAAPVGNKSHGKLPTKEQEDSGEGWGEPESAATQHGGIECGDSDLRKHSKPPVPLPVPGSGRTLRETVLESSPILALLNESFISSWSLVKELEELQVRLTPLLGVPRGARGRGSSHLCRGIFVPSPPCPRPLQGPSRHQMEAG